MYIGDLLWLAEAPGKCGFLLDPQRLKTSITASEGFLPVADRHLAASQATPKFRWMPHRSWKWTKSNQGTWKQMIELDPDVVDFTDDEVCKAVKRERRVRSWIFGSTILRAGRRRTSATFQQGRCLNGSRLWQKP
jgi:hypothetical protein